MSTRRPGPGTGEAQPYRDQEVADELHEERRMDSRVAFTRRVISLGEGPAHVLLGRDLSVGGMWAEPNPWLTIGYELRLACPQSLSPSENAVNWARNHGASITVTESTEEAVSGADCIVSDAWVSMHDDQKSDRHNFLAPYQVNQRLMARAKPDAVFMHCLPAHRGEEVTAAVIDGPRSLVWDEAENRLHAQKGILTWCLG